MRHEFVTFREADEEGNLRYFIAQKDFPNLVAEISQTPNKKFVDAVVIGEYNLWICLVGTMRGAYIPAYNDIDKEIIFVMQEMGQWFLTTRINADLKKYKKWKT